MIRKAGGFTASQMATPEARAVITETASVLCDALQRGLSHEVPATLRYALEENAFIFSGFKCFHSLREVGLSLTDSNGNIKPFEEFTKDVQKISQAYNRNYLYAEYNHAVAASQMAEKWQRWEQDGDRYDLQYRTAQDDRVREAHRLLHGTTLPPSDPFWERYLPPNGWNCRCTAVQVRKGKYPQSDPTLAMQRGDNSTASLKQQIFRYNPGKTLQLFPPKHPYYKAPEEAKKVAEHIARIEQNRREYERLKEDPDYKDVHFDPKTGGVKATHKGHNTEDTTVVAFGMTGPQLEAECQDVAYRLGHRFILRNEKILREGTFFHEYKTELDAEVDGRITDIRSITELKDSYKWGLNAKNRQIKRFNREHDEIADTVILYFHDSNMYSRGQIEQSIDDLKNIEAHDEEGNPLGRKITVYLKHVICVTSEGQWEEYDI